jgi:hypothetical protein
MSAVSKLPVRTEEDLLAQFCIPCMDSSEGGGNPKKRQKTEGQPNFKFTKGSLFLKRKESQKVLTQLAFKSCCNKRCLIRQFGKEIDNDIFDKIKQLEPNTCVLVKQGNLNDLLKQYVKQYNECPKVKFESKTNIKTIIMDKKNNICINTTETLIDNKLIQDVCEKEEIKYENQSIGTLLYALIEKFYKKNI